MLTWVQDLPNRTNHSYETYDLDVWLSWCNIVVRGDEDPSRRLRGFRSIWYQGKLLSDHMLILEARLMAAEHGELLAISPVGIVVGEHFRMLAKQACIICIM